MDASHLASNHEEADTKLLLHAVNATISGPTSIEIMSPDTDVFVLSIAQEISTIVSEYNVCYRKREAFTKDRIETNCGRPGTGKNCSTSWLSRMEWSRCNQKFCT